MAHIKLSKSLSTLKSSAKKLSVNEKISYAKALDLIAQSEGFTSWSLLSDKFSASIIATMDNVWENVFPDQLVMLAARPMIGKVSLAVNFALLAAKENKQVVYISLHEKKSAIENRFIAVYAALTQEKLLMPITSLHVNDAELIRQAKQDLNQYPLTIYEKDHLDYDAILKIFSDVTAAPKLLLIDYLQLLKSADLEKMLLQLKTLAREKHCCIILLSQLREAINSRPTLNDVLGGKALARHCDYVLGLYRQSVYEPSANSKKADIHILKSRMKAQAILALNFNASNGVFTW